MSLNFKADPCFLICGLDCFYTGNAKNYGSCPLDKILYSGYLANPCLCFWTTNFIQWLAVHWISSVQWTTLSSILNNRALRTPRRVSIIVQKNYFVKSGCSCNCYRQIAKLKKWYRFDRLSFYMTPHVWILNIHCVLF